MKFHHFLFTPFFLLFFFNGIAQNENNIQTESLGFYQKKAQTYQFPGKFTKEKESYFDFKSIKKNVKDNEVVSNMPIITPKDNSLRPGMPIQKPSANGIAMPIFVPNTKSKNRS